MDFIDTYLKYTIATIPIALLYFFYKIYIDEKSSKYSPKIKNWSAWILAIVLIYPLNNILKNIFIEVINEIMSPVSNFVLSVFLLILLTIIGLVFTVLIISIPKEGKYPKFVIPLLGIVFIIIISYNENQANHRVTNLYIIILYLFTIIASRNFIPKSKVIV
jgi:hypothetical protein